MGAAWLCVGVGALLEGGEKDFRSFNCALQRLTAVALVASSALWVASGSTACGRHCFIIQSHGPVLLLYSYPSSPSGGSHIPYSIFINPSRKILIFIARMEHLAPYFTYSVGALFCPYSILSTKQSASDLRQSRYL